MENSNSIQIPVYPADCENIKKLKHEGHAVVGICSGFTINGILKPIGVTVHIIAYDELDKEHYEYPIDRYSLVRDVGEALKNHVMK